MAATPIVALDFSTDTAALAMVRELGDRCRFYKVGSQLFTAAGPGIVTELRRIGCEVFLDLKFHDIPNTVSRAVVSAAALGVRLVTVHAAGGATMLRAAVAAAGSGSQSSCGILAVTVLTSLSAADVATAWGREPSLDVATEVLRFAAAAEEAGAHGIVCGGREAAAVRERFGDRLAVLVPGVRLAGDGAQDQSRVVSPREAANAGARYVVVGRPVTAADDPRAAMERVAAELA